MAVLNLPALSFTADAAENLSGSQRAKIEISLVIYFVNERFGQASPHPPLSQAIECKDWHRSLSSHFPLYLSFTSGVHLFAPLHDRRVLRFHLTAQLTSAYHRRWPPFDPASPSRYLTPSHSPSFDLFQSSFTSRAGDLDAPFCSPPHTSPPRAGSSA